jgi:hypothetical protein
MQSNFERAVAIALMVEARGFRFGAIEGAIAIYILDGHAYSVVGGMGQDLGDWFEFARSPASRSLAVDFN